MTMMSAHYAKLSRCLATNRRNLLVSSSSSTTSSISLSLPCHKQSDIWKRSYMSPSFRLISIGTNHKFDNENNRYYDSTGSVVSRKSRSFTTTAKTESPAVVISNTKNTISSSSSSSSNGPKSSGGRGQRHQQVEEHIVKLNGQMRIQYRHADYRGALESCRVVLEECTAFYPSEHPAVASAHVNIGLMLKQLGDYDEARTHYQTALDMYATLVGTDHASYAAALHNMGTLDRAQSQIPFTDDTSTDDGDGDVDDVVSEEDVQKRKELSLKLNQSAIHYFEQALEIRTAELGEHHAYTITTRSALGTALASQVLATEASNDDNNNNSSKNILSNDQWQVAQEHLQKSLQLAIQNPRGPQIQPPTDNDNDSDSDSAKRRDRSKSKKERREFSKLQKKRKSNNTNTATSGSINSNVTTMAAAGAAQNLAIFYKLRADVSQDYDFYVQAENLYRSALVVRSQLLPSPSTHPTVLETKFSLAELYSAMNKEEDAQSLREEILSAYDIQEKDEDDQASSPTTPN